MSKRISSFQVILLCVFGAIGVAGILIFALATAGNGGNSIAPVTVWGTFDQTTVKEILRTAAEQDQRLTQVTYVQKNPATFEQDLANALASGQGPDLFIMRSDEALYDQSKVYAIPYGTLSQSQFSSAFVDGSVPYLSDNGVLALPLFVDPLVLYWNKDELATGGIAQPPQYWDQLPAMMQQLVKKDSAGNLQKEGIALGTYQNINAAKDILAMLIQQAGGQIVARNAAGQYVPALSLGGGASISAQSALNFYTEFANPSQTDYTWNDAQPSARQAFAAGNLAMYIGYASEEPLILTANPNLNFSASSAPQVRSDQNSIDAGTVYGIAVVRTSPNLQSALTVAYLLASAPVDQALSEVLGLAPARRDVIAASTSSAPYAQLFDKMALVTRTWADPDPSQTAPIFQAMIEDTDSGAASAVDAIGRANQQIGNLLPQQQQSQ
ncbi:MAG TPA: extracellular solute-binding protein [Candidatus Paceibacterota bacterium]|jgi:ABC-type glycerol-3-phosphate transport system substrate-binding protein|nr:extracellular solute-binding protein [Candidatus Paceibacterota bacterium]